MANTTKKTTVKKTVTKKTPAKKPVAKKAPVIEKHPCGCGGECACHKHHCSFWKKLIVALVFFALGFAAAKTMPCQKRFNKMPKPEFDNGCLVVKNPKIIENMDTNKDGCVDKDEFKSFRQQARKHHQPKPAPHPEVSAEQPAEQM